MWALLADLLADSLPAGCWDSHHVFKFLLKLSLKLPARMKPVGKMSAKSCVICETWGLEEVPGHADLPPDI